MNLEQELRAIAAVSEEARQHGVLISLRFSIDKSDDDLVIVVDIRERRSDEMLQQTIMASNWDCDNAHGLLIAPQVCDALRKSFQVQVAL